MPIYEYACSTCGHKFELFQRMNADPPASCPSCGAPDVRKLISLSSFILKGSGWYRDLYGLEKSAGNKDTTADKPSPAKESVGTSQTTPSSTAKGSTTTSATASVSP